MFNIFFLNMFNELMVEQTKNLEKLIDFKMHQGIITNNAKEVENQIRWAEREKMDAIICSWEDYEQMMSYKPLVPVYPVRITAYDTSVILHSLKKYLKERHLEHYRRVILGTYLPISVRLDILEEMFDFELINPPWEDELSQSYFDSFAKEGYQVVVCAPKYIDKVRNSGMHPFHDEQVNQYIDFSQDIKQVIQQVAIGSQLQKTLEEMENMLNNSFEAICILDNTGRVTAYNEKSEQMFKLNNDRKYAGYFFYDLVPAVSKEEVLEVLTSGKAFYSRIINANNYMGMLNITPNHKERDANGAVVHFTTIQQIEKMEIQVKSEIYKKGHYAKYKFTDILGVSEIIQKTKKLAERFSKYNSNILLYGESGCGKELFAQSIHNAGLRVNQPFVAVNCGSLPANLLESELFGYVEGAFTGALKKGKKGLFEIAHKGTIFLDEISEMDTQGQTRLLRVLEERCVMRIGDDKVIPVDVRVVTASNKNLLRLVKEGKFREDLYYRLNVLTLNIPPLREREEDVILIANAYINKYGEEYRKHIVLSDSANKELMNFSWEGNVRQLRNFCERLVIVADEIEIAGCDIREQLAVMGMAIFERAIETEKEITENVRDITESVNNIKTAERISICNALRKANGNRECASKMLGISKSTLWRKMKEFEISEKY
ncbi:sigma-54 interaction domain-containing protein [uncultured Robinsoniella sp.]|uniref:sigma-54 interaction domain-containing protein n=1 Tax=uncultured Robinsoniella sp. TaxID=904190 RepID=UPI00374FC05B